MKPYAVHNPRFDVHDDVLGCVVNARRGSFGNLPGKGGDIHAMRRNSDAKRRARTRFNKGARTALRRDLVALLSESAEEEG